MKIDNVEIPQDMIDRWRTSGSALVGTGVTTGEIEMQLLGFFHTNGCRVSNSMIQEQFRFPSKDARSARIGGLRRFLNGCGPLIIGFPDQDARKGCSTIFWYTMSSDAIGLRKDTAARAKRAVGILAPAADNLRKEMMLAPSPMEYENLRRLYEPVFMAFEMSKLQLQEAEARGLLTAGPQRPTDEDLGITVPQSADSHDRAMLDASQRAREVFKQISSTAKKK